MTSVRAFQPRKIDPPHYVADDYDELAEHIGEEVPGEQCDSCGNSLYRIEARGPDRTTATHYVAVCVTDENRVGEDEFTGCGAEYRIDIWPEEEVVF